MQISTKSNTIARRVGVLLFDQFSTHCLANAVEPLRAANSLARAELFRWSFLTMDGAGVASSSGRPVLADGRLSDHPGGDLLFVLPSYGHQRFATPTTARALRTAALRFDMLVGMDTGSWLLAAAGLLEGYDATIHWDEIDAFAEAFPAVRTLPARHVIDRGRATCGGATTAFDLVLELIGVGQGQSLRLEVASLFMHGERTAPWPRPSGSSIVDAAVAIMRRNVETPLSVPDLARALGCTQRRLERTFAARVSESPRKVYQRIRLLAARRLLEQTALGMAEIALRSGYSDASALARAYRAQFGESPGTTRARVEL